MDLFESSAIHHRFSPSHISALPQDCFQQQDQAPRGSKKNAEMSRLLVEFIAVFSTPELLENILAVSHPVDMLTAMQQAQDCWRDIVRGSVSLMRKLGLESFED
ncbi:hypothetical protein AC578_4576 [Pseudocercospora eumusae]|uniref:F-box domain-containing protein n=1 Tax=Pseudocercospora eumusae TaxID=321146 RepID=A0A139H4A8_9PEZI|nr:hypothetical protein AC578_4576 [Pseudocercospora eumusae]